MTDFAWIIYGKLLTEQISIMNLSSVLKDNNINPVLIYSHSQKDILEKIQRIKPKVLGFSLMYGSHWKYQDLSYKIRARFPEIFQLAGGPFTTFYPKSIEEFSFDAIAIGEADLSLPKLLKKLQNNEQFTDTKGFYFYQNNKLIKNDLENLLENLSSISFPNREILYQNDPLLKNQEFKSFLSGRGCPYPCTYCFNHKFNKMFKDKGRIIRKKPVDYFIEEIIRTKEKFGCQLAIFEDDIFVINRSWLEDFATKFKKEVNIPYICYLRADLVTPNLCQLLKESGCHIVRMAIETGNEQIRNTILKRNMSNDKIIKASDLIHKFGLKLSVSNMIGLPTETDKALEDTVKLNIRCRPEHPTAQFFMPYPNMELSKIAIEKGNFKDDLFKSIPKNTWKYTPLIFDKKTKQKMEKTQKMFALIVKYPKFRNFFEALFILPDQILYLISMITKIIIVTNYFPPTKVTLKQRLRVLIRFFKFYG